MPTPKTILSSAAATRLGVSLAHVALLCRNGELRGSKVGRDWIIDEASLRERQRRLAGRPRKGHPGGIRKAAKP